MSAVDDSDSSDQTQYIIIKGQPHQPEQQQNSDLLTDGLQGF
jgi:hypothetical protein